MIDRYMLYMPSAWKRWLACIARDGVERSPKFQVALTGSPDEVFIKDTSAFTQDNVSGERKEASGFEINIKPCFATLSVHPLLSVTTNETSILPGRLYA